MFVCCECCVLSARGFNDELITRPEESYRLWWVVMFDLETSRMRRPWPALGRSATARLFVLVLTALAVIFVGSLQTAHPFALKYPNCHLLEWDRLWNTASMLSHSRPGRWWLPSLGVGLVIPSTFAKTQVRAEGRIVSLHVNNTNNTCKTRDFQYTKNSCSCIFH
jgi:hypothetical protein